MTTEFPIECTSVPVHVKLGTQSTLVYFHPDDTANQGDNVRYKEYPWEPWSPWKRAYVHDVNPLHFLEKM